MVAAADVADFPLDGRGRGELLLLIDRFRVGRIGVRIGIVVRVGVIRVCERRAQEDPTDEGGPETAATEAAVAKAVMGSSVEPATAMEPATASSPCGGRGGEREGENPYQHNRKNLSDHGAPPPSDL